MLYERGLYAAPAQTLLWRLRTVRDEVRSLMLVGHNLGIEELALLLAARGERLGALREKFPTGGLATLELETEWSELDRGVAQLTGFVVPRELAPG